MKTVYLSYTVKLGKARDLCMTTTPCYPTTLHTCLLVCDECERQAKARRTFKMTVDGLKTNAPVADMFYLSEARLGNVNLVDCNKPVGWRLDGHDCLKGIPVKGVLDEVTGERYSTELTGLMNAMVRGKYTGKVPAGMREGEDFTFTVVLSGS